MDCYTTVHVVGASLFLCFQSHYLNLAHRPKSETREGNYLQKENSKHSFTKKLMKLVSIMATE